VHMRVRDFLKKIISQREIAGTLDALKNGP
jgi:hypothetical protein